MKAISEVKPINVLSRFIASWIRDRWQETAPFDSFETLRTRPIEQKDVERWVLNCNYVYYRLGDELLENDLFPEDDTASTEMLRSLGDEFKSIRDSNPLKLRSKQRDAIAAELEKDWPPFSGKSRNDLHKILPELRRFNDRFSSASPGLADTIPDFAKELVDEASRYRHMAKRAAAIDATEIFRELTALWCLKEINPLFTLTLWQDRAAVEKLALELADSFSANSYPLFDGGSRRAEYLGAVASAQSLYLDSLNDESRGTAGIEFRALSIPELDDLLEKECFSLERPAPSRILPPWLAGKAALIWNVAICSILGPRHAIRPMGAIRTQTTMQPPSGARSGSELQGEVLLRRILPAGEREGAASIDLSSRRPFEEKFRLTSLEGDSPFYLWCVIGSSYDPQVRVPELLEHAGEVPSRFISTRRYDAHGTQVSGIGDSRYHTALLFERRPSGWRLLLRDLGSKNGTYVTRSGPTGTRYLALRNRQAADELAWAQRLMVPAEAVSIHEMVELRRGDVIQLSGSCFEIV